MSDTKGFGSFGAGGNRQAGTAPHVDVRTVADRNDGSRSYPAFEPVEVRTDGWESFTYEPTEVVPALGSRTVGQPAVASAAPGALPRGIRGSGDADRQIDEAIFGLSSPARPRNANPAETQSFAPAREADFDLDPPQAITLDDFDELISSELAAMRGPSLGADAQDDDYGLGYDEVGDDHHAYDDYPVRTRSRLRSAVLMGGVAVLALVAIGGAATMFMPGGVSTDGSLLIKADTEPYKIAPADPGGRSIPNQNKAVYQKVAGQTATTPPQQESLVTAMEEPLEIAEEQDAPVETLPGVDVGDEIALPGQEPAQQEVASVEPAEEADGTLQPRKVRTFSVRPDGTLIATEMPEPAGASLLTEAASMRAHAAALDPVAGIPPAMPLSADQPDLTTASTSVPVEEPPVAAPVVETPTQPESQQVAAIQAPEPADAFFVQIASQPSQAAAEESLANLGRRYESVIGGRSLGIKSADIPGKGTYYRVRVATATRSEANSLCENLKSAGGSCFVTR